MKEVLRWDVVDRDGSRVTLDVIRTGSRWVSDTGIGHDVRSDVSAAHCAHEVVGRMMADGARVTDLVPYGEPSRRELRAVLETGRLQRIHWGMWRQIRSGYESCQNGV